MALHRVKDVRLVKSKLQYCDIGCIPLVCIMCNIWKLAFIVVQGERDSVTSLRIMTGWKGSLLWVHSRYAYIYMVMLKISLSFSPYLLSSQKAV